MKTFKPKDLGLLHRPVSFGGGQYLSLSAVVYFDLSDPAAKLSEQDMWKELPVMLPKGARLDDIWPKPNAEVLLAGSAHAPGGEPVKGLTVDVRVGDLTKELAVFGDRQWTFADNVPVSITEPAPFTAMPLDWRLAFGGRDVLENPDGKGADVSKTPDGKPFLPLPNIEDPKALIGSPQDRPAPAGTGPVDFTRPSRRRYEGTYDDKWKRERWPGFPEDFNPLFFQTAPAGQMFTGYFSGGESIELTNLHPQRPVIASSLPPRRPRLFLTRQEGDAPGPFEEVALHPETLWLFPEKLRGVLIWRGLTKMDSPDYEDVARIYGAVEDAGEEPKPIEHHRDEEARLMDRMVKARQGPVLDIKKKLDRAMLKTRRAPLIIEKAKRAILGQAPAMPREPEDMDALRALTMTEARRNLDKLETHARDLHARFGHVASIDLTRFDRHRAKLDAVDAHLSKTTADIRGTLDRAAKAKTDAAAAVSGHFTPEQLAAAGLNPAAPPDPQSPLSPPAPQGLLDPLAAAPVSPFHDAHFPLAVRYRRALERDPAAYARLRSLGFSRGTIAEAWMGLNGDGSGPVPAGVTLPRFTGPELTGLAVNADWLASESDVAGSAPGPLLLEGSPGSPVAVVPSRLEAWLVHQECAEFLHVLAAPDTASATGTDVASAPCLLVILPQGTTKPDDGWAALNPKVVPCELPKGASVLEAKEHGYSLRDAILDALPPAAVGIDPDAPAEPESYPFPDIKGLVVQAIADISAAKGFSPEALMGRGKGMLDLFISQMAKSGRPQAEIDELAARFAEQPEAQAKTWAEYGRDAVDRLEETRAALERQGALTPEHAASIEQAKAKLTEVTADADARWAEGMAKAEAAKNREPLPEMRAAFADAGMDLDAIRRRTRQEVADMHAAGKKLAGAILSGQDLSGLDLSGQDFTGCRLAGTNFTGCVLDGALFKQVTGRKTVFDKASLKNARLEHSALTKASLKGADLSGATLKLLALPGADLSGASLRGASLDQCIVKKAVFDGADLEGVATRLTLLSGSAAKASFKGASLQKTIFKKSAMDGADFSGSRLNATLFSGNTGQGVSFHGANLDGFRMGQRCDLQTPDFTGVTMKQGGLSDSRLAGADFTGASVTESLLTRVELTGADLNRTRLKRTRFRSCNLEKANLQGADLGGGSLKRTRIVEADLSLSNLYAVDFFKAVAGKTNFDGANLERTFLEGRVQYLDDDAKQS